MKKDEVQVLIETAVMAAVEAGMKGIDEKLQKAVNLGVTIGAVTGAEAGAAAAVKAADRVRRSYQKQQYDWKYHNTKLLLRNYRRLNAYYENVVFNAETAKEADEDFAGLMQSMGQPTDDEIFVESIRKNYITTRIIMTHVNKMLECYKIMCERSSRPDDARRWRVLEGLYIANGYTTAEEIAQREQIDKRTVYKDIDACAADLTALFFGVGGIEIL